MKVAALLLLSLSVCQGYYLVPHPFLHPLSPFWTFRATPGLPLGPLVIDLASDYECPGDGTFPNLEDACDSFFMCSEGKHHKMTCNPGLKFDGSIGQCNWEDEVIRTEPNSSSSLTCIELSNLGG